MMDFATAWDALEIGALVKVRDGRGAEGAGSPPPSANTTGHAYRLWASHNFTGDLIEKIGGDFRAMRFGLDNDLGNRIGYTVQEGWGHRFEEVEP